MSGTASCDFDCAGGSPKKSRPCTSESSDGPTPTRPFEIFPFLCVGESFECGAIRDRHGRSLYGNQMAFLEITQSARDGLASRSDEFRDLFMRQGELHPRAVLRL